MDLPLDSTRSLSVVSESLPGTDPQHQLTKRQNSTLFLQATPNILVTPTLRERMMSAVTLSPSV